MEPRVLQAPYSFGVDRGRKKEEVLPFLPLSSEDVEIQKWHLENDLLRSHSSRWLGATQKDE